MLYCKSGRSPISAFTSGVAGVAMLGLLAGCTVEPLNASRAAPAIDATGSKSTQAILASTAVSPVTSRVAQQVRNALLFAMNGGRLQQGGAYRVDLYVVATVASLSVQASSLAPTSSQVRLTARYNMIEQATNKSVATGSHIAIAGFDKTNQSFANERAERDAKNRASREVAQQIRLSLAQAITKF